jgi:hypothetical protein
LAVARDGWHPVSCHTRKIAEGIWHHSAHLLHGHWECAGASIFRANTRVMFFRTRNKWLQLPANRINVFASPAEFEAHHKEIR